MNVTFLYVDVGPLPGVMHVMVTVNRCGKAEYAVFRVDEGIRLSTERCAETHARELQNAKIDPAGTQDHQENRQLTFRDQVTRTTLHASYRNTVCYQRGSNPRSLPSNYSRALWHSLG